MGLLSNNLVTCIVFLCSSHLIHSAFIRRDNFTVNRLNIDDYHAKRKELIDFEAKYGFGSDIQLNAKEQAANNIIMMAKESEYTDSISAPSKFLPSRHIFETFATIRESKLFQIIQAMPKGGILHAHSSALCSADYTVSLTYWPHLWQLSYPNGTGVVDFVFSLDQPSMVSLYEFADQRYVWLLVSEVRAEMGANNYDKYARTLFTLYDPNVEDPRVQFNDINEVWRKFGSIATHYLVRYAPVWKAYYKQALKEAYDDGVQYLEVRSTLHQLYDLNGTIFTKEDNLRLYLEALNEFQLEHPDFIGSKVIYAPIKRKVGDCAELVKIAMQLKKKFPDFMVGFDLVGQEDTAPMLVNYAEHILKLPSDMQLFFHAGETNWFGSIDENLVDAVLLGAKRIGHGYGLVKHPKLIELIKERNVAIEINPVSNQVLKLVDDFRNHPAAILMAQNVQIIIAPDDPAMWEVSQLSHDFYIAFLGIASRQSDLRTLKKFILNSIEYSALNAKEKSIALAKWQTKWDAFIENLKYL